MAGELSAEEVAKHASRIEEDGYTIVPEVLSKDEVETILSELLELEETLGIRPRKNPFEGSQTMRAYNLVTHGETFWRLSVHDKILPIVERVLDPQCLISSLSSIGILPGERAQPIHADDQVIPIRKPHAPIVCNSMWAITDFTEENGATRIIPGSHKRDHNPIFGAEYESEAAVMSAGSVMVYDGAMWHGGGANQSDERRTGIAMNYCAGFIRQQENQQLGIPLELVKTLPERVQELIGYSVYRALIGHIDHGHPGKLLK
jgi:ectoine hydroxylase-related dioxygenase (phytanoyl-CoA dioxygenase family)